MFFCFVPWRRLQKSGDGKATIGGQIIQEKKRREMAKAELGIKGKNQKLGLGRLGDSWIGIKRPGRAKQSRQYWWRRKKSCFDVFCLIDCKLSTVAILVAYIKIFGFAYQESSLARQSHSLLFTPFTSSIQYVQRIARHVFKLINVFLIAMSLQGDD